MSLVHKKRETSLYFCLYPNYANFKIYKKRTKRSIKCDLDEDENTSKTSYYKMLLKNN